MISRDHPLTRWLPGTGLVDADGALVTKAQEYKARQILKRGLIQEPRTIERSRDRVVNAYACHPLPGCKLTYELKHTQWRTATGAVLNTFDCNCQGSRGGPNTRALRECCHELALKQKILGGVL